MVETPDARTGCHEVNDTWQEWVAGHMLSQAWFKRKKRGTMVDVHEANHIFAAISMADTSRCDDDCALRTEKVANIKTVIEAKE